MTYINHIGVAVPEYQHSQSDILQFMLQSGSCDEAEARRLSLMYGRSGINQRHSVLPDYGVAMQERIFYPKTTDLEPFPNVDLRMQFFEENACNLAQKAIFDAVSREKLATVTHLITVSCTGLMAPGLDIQLIEALHLPTNIVRTSVNFMGCYAAIHALKIADAFCKADAQAQVLVVCVELCTLHFQKQNTPDFQTSNLLFADGAAACWLSNSPNGSKIEGFYAELALQGQTDMAWRVSEHGFLMTLSSHIPKLLENGIEQLIANALRNHNLNLQEIAHWAIHPGGKGILEAVQKALKIGIDDCWASYEVLKNYGNMSSATILFVLKKMMDTNTQGNTFAVAFGPGLTMESMILSR